MENNIVNKQRFFCLYFGQQVARYVLNDGSYAKSTDVHPIGLMNAADYLELKSLSSITNEDAIEVAKLCVPKFIVVRTLEGDKYLRTFYNDCDDYLMLSKDKFKIGWCLKSGMRIEDSFYPSAVIDFLRSRGYLLPFMDLSVEDILKYGWAVIKP